MHINYEKLISNEKALEKYKTRDCKIFCIDRQLWLTENGYCSNRKDAFIFVFELFKIMIGKNYNAEVHFISELGEFETPNLLEMNEDDIYNNVLIRFDRFTTKFGK